MFDPGGIVGVKEKAALAGVFAIAMLITAIVFVFGQNLLIVRPLLYLTAGARRLSRGDYNIQLRLDQRDEIGDLTESFNDMAAKISDYTRTLEARVEERTRELQAAEEHTRLILESAGEGVFGVDLEGCITFVNPQAGTLLGYSADEMIGAKAHPLFHHTRADGSDYPVEECWMYQSYTYGDSFRIDDEVLWRKDGTSFEIEYHSTPLRKNDELKGAVISFTDISARKEAEKTIRKQERHLRAIIDNIPMVIILKDREGRHLTVNNYYETATGVAPQAVLGKTDSEILPKEVAETIMLMDREIMESGRARSFEERVPNPDGNTHDFLTTKVPVTNSDNEVETLVVAALDITERKLAEEKLRDAYEVISSSIDYASQIQRSLLPPDRYLSEDFAEHFVIWEPRDVVGGDLYWYRRCRRGFVIVLADCTGHGVPGAFMTMLATGALDRALRDRPDGDPAHLLPLMNRSIQYSLSQDQDAGESDDGLELGICLIDVDARTLVYAGARFSLFRVNGDGIAEIKGDKSGIGYRHVPADQTFTNHEIPLLDGEVFYMTADGLTDQVGGAKRRAFGKRRFQDVIASVQNLPLVEQGDRIVAALSDYQGDEKRRDDVSVVGFRV